MWEWRRPLQAGRGDRVPLPAGAAGTRRGDRSCAPCAPLARVEAMAPCARPTIGQVEIPVSLIESEPRAEAERARLAGLTGEEYEQQRGL